MARVRDILYRFRPAGSPGAPGTAGVPVDRGADLAAELAPVFAHLAEAETACTALVEGVRRDAAARRRRAVDSAHALVAQARDQATVERAAAAAAAERAGEPELAALRADAEQEAVELGGRAAERTPEHVARVVALVRTIADLPPAEGAGAA